MERYYMSVENHIKVSSFLWQTSILLYVVSVYLIGVTNDELIVGFAFYSIFALPALYLHLEYLIKNRGQTIQVESAKLILTEGNISTDYRFEDMEKVILYKSASLDKGGIPLSPIESYHYARIVTKSKEELIITCLLAPKVDEVVDLLKGVKNERKKRPFCTIFWR